MTQPNPTAPHWAQGLPLPLQQAVRHAVLGRMHRQTEAVQALLQQRWGDTPDDTPDRFPTGAPVPMAAPPGKPVAAMPPSPLAQLVRRLQHEDGAIGTAGRPPGGTVPEAGTPTPSPSRMRSVQRFGQLARQVAVEQQVAKALRASAAHAGPLNPSRLVQRVLQHMQDLSPEYLHQFMEQMDTLLWLDENPVARVVKKKSKQRTLNKR